MNKFLCSLCLVVLACTSSMAQNRMVVDPSYAVLKYRGYQNSIGDYPAPVFINPHLLYADSMALFDDGGGNQWYTGEIKSGMTFDPQSIIFDTTGTYSNPLFNSNDTYSIDSLWIGAVYKRVSASAIVDTLYIELVWGDSTDANVFSTFSYSVFPGAPYDYGTMIYPSYTHNTSSTGNTCFLSAPSTNRRFIKYFLSESDTALINYTNQIAIDLNAYGGPISLSGHQKLSVGVTFFGGENSANQVICYGGTGTSTQTRNGFSILAYEQQVPNYPAGIQYYANYFDDPAPGKNGSYQIFKDNSYNVQLAPGLMYPVTTPQIGYMIRFSLQGSSSVNPCYVNPSLTITPDPNTPGYYNITEQSTASGTVTNYFWEFGDGGTSTQQYPSYQYAVPGQYVICLTLTSTNGTYTCSNTYCDSSSVQKIASGFLMSHITVIDPSNIPTSINDPSEQDAFTVYPNPVQNDLTISFKQTPPKCNLWLTDALGKTILRSTINDLTTKINTEALQKGFYMLSLLDENGKSVGVKKIVK